MHRKPCIVKPFVLIIAGLLSALFFSTQVRAELGPVQYRGSDGRVYVYPAAPRPNVTIAGYSFYTETQLRALLDWYNNHPYLTLEQRRYWINFCIRENANRERMADEAIARRFSW